MARYKRSHTGAGVSLESETERVPEDGRFHLLRGDEIISSFKTLRSGTTAYLKLVEELGFTTKPLPESELPSASGPTPPPFTGDFYVYGKSKRRKTGTRTFG